MVTDAEELHLHRRHDQRHRRLQRPGRRGRPVPHQDGQQGQCGVAARARARPAPPRRAAISLTPEGDVVVAGTVSGEFQNGSTDDTNMLVARFSKAMATSSSPPPLGGLGGDEPPPPSRWGRTAPSMSRARPLGRWRRLCRPSRQEREGRRQAHSARQRRLRHASTGWRSTDRAIC